MYERPTTYIKQSGSSGFAAVRPASALARGYPDQSGYPRNPLRFTHSSVIACVALQSPMPTLLFLLWAHHSIYTTYNNKLVQQLLLLNLG
jgi:hypothetical protein